MWKQVITFTKLNTFIPDSIYRPYDGGNKWIRQSRKHEIIKIVLKRPATIWAFLFILRWWSLMSLYVHPIPYFLNDNLTIIHYRTAYTLHANQIESPKGGPQQVAVDLLLGFVVLLINQNSLNHNNPMSFCNNLFHYHPTSHTNETYIHSHVYMQTENEPTHYIYT